jgi:hypothetical protein
MVNIGEIIFSDWFGWPQEAEPSSLSASGKSRLITILADVKPILAHGTGYKVSEGV